MEQINQLSRYFPLVKGIPNVLKQVSTIKRDRIGFPPMELLRLMDQWNSEVQQQSGTTSRVPTKNNCDVTQVRFDLTALLCYHRAVE